MDVFDKFFERYSYKFPKGYPDLTNDEDVNILQSLLEENNVSQYNVFMINEDAEAIKQELIDNGYNKDDIIIKTKKQIRLLTKGTERKSTINNLVKDLEYVYEPDFKGSSIGAVIAKDNVAIIVKPKERQGTSSSGLDNEQILVNTINQYIEESPINIIFKGDNKSITINNITEAKSVGTNTKGYKKADVCLLSNDKIVANLSLKKSNAVIWESADSRYKELVVHLADKLINNPFPNVGLRKTEKKGIYHLYNPKTDKDLSGIVITNLPNNENEEIIFGTDNPKTKVIKHTFQESDFTFKNNTLTIKSGVIFTELSDIEGTDYEPILVVRHDSTRTNTNGLRPIVNYRSYAYKNNELQFSQVEIPYKKAIS